jgi:Protein-disulfide isomerase
LNFHRRDFLALGAAAVTAGVAVPGIAMAEEGDTFDTAALMAPKGWTDIPLGAEDAPVTLIEYSSPTCPHCAAFANEVFPAFKEAYVDTGKVRFILRPFARNVIDAAIFMVALDAGPDRFHDVLDTYFATQSTWSTAPDPKAALLAVAVQLGFTEERFDELLRDQDTFVGLEAARQQAMDEFKLAGTPTFYLNGKQLTGNKTVEMLAAEIDPLL